MQEEELQEKRAEFERKKAEIDKSMRNLENQVTVCTFYCLNFGLM